METILEHGRSERNYWRDLWRFRELFYILAWRDLTVRYKQTAIGVAWALLKPGLTMLVFVGFRKITKMSVAGDPDPIFVLAALLPWMFFSTAPCGQRRPPETAGDRHEQFTRGRAGPCEQPRHHVAELEQEHAPGIAARDQTFGWMKQRRLPACQWPGCNAWKKQIKFASRLLSRQRRISQGRQLILIFH